MTTTSIQGTTFSFGQRQNSLDIQAFQGDFQDGIQLGEVEGQQNRAVSNVGPFKISAVNSLEANVKRSDFVDRTFLDQGEGIGIVDGDDSTPTTRKRIDGDEALQITLTNDHEANSVSIDLDRITSEDGATITVVFLDGDRLVDTQQIDLGIVPTRQIQTLDLDSDFFFDTVQISAGDEDTAFTFRSIAFLDAVPVTNLSVGQRLTRLEIEARENGVLVERVEGEQNRPAPDAGVFDLFAVDSADSNPNRSNLVDRTFFDQGEGIGIIDGDDSTPGLQTRIDGDEILGISSVGFVADEALIRVDRVTSEDGAEIRVEAFKDGALVDVGVFSLGSESPRDIQTVNFISNGLFDTLQISAADSDTQFTFRSLELPEAFVV